MTRYFESRIYTAIVAALVLGIAICAVLEW